MAAMEESLQSGSEPVANNEIRQRINKEAHKPQQAASADDARETVMQLNAAQESSGKDEKDRRTFGRTPDGRVFTVPHTEDMVSQLLSPTQPKNISDILILANLGILLLALWLLPKALKQPFFAIAFLFWRACYNGGIGYLLYEQSNYKSLVLWAKKSGIFEHPSTGKNPHPKLYPYLKREMETKIPKDYTFEDAPLEYNTWLLFRRVVDLILMSDFISYCCFAAACGGTPPGEHFTMTIARWAAGWALILFNLWVKLDAHRVVKDFAWYWGDFFYLIDQELTFDGVFEMAPHPMYSVGYAGFYGISILAASYKVLFISIIGHAAQFVFLAWVENPHIEKTYNPPPPRRRLSEPHDLEMTDSQTLDTTFEPTSPTLGAAQQPQPAYVRDLLGIQNIDLHRTVDISVLLLQLYMFAFALLTPSTGGYQAFFVLNAFAWRLWYSLGIGYILNRQSKKKSWVRHFIKYGESIEESWRQWKGIYHLSMTMCYASFIAAAYKMYTLPEDWNVGMVLLRHVTGAGLITLHLWVVFSIYESLGEFGWFFGDFFFDKTPKLTYSGIYRFLNNPERVIGIAGLWGLALITWSKSVFMLAFLSHILTLGFLQFIERPHMQKRYGKSLREHSGISKTVSNTLPKSVRTWQGKVDQIVDQTVDSVEDFIDSATPKLSASVDALVKDTKTILRRYPAKMSITRLGDLDGFDRKDYSIEVIGTPSPSNRAALDKVSKREGLLARRDSFKGKEFQPPNFAFGAPIRVKWTAPLHHGKKDWIGLYMIADNASREVTRISSQGRWIATTEGSFDSYRADQGIIVSNKQVIQWDNDQGKPLMTGEMEFAGDKLWWTTGVFEFRYHHDGMHNVMAISQPFEIRIGKFDESDVSEGPNETLKSAVEKALLPVVQNCFDRDPEIAPSASEEAYGTLVERDGKFARRVVFAVWQMFGIELAPEVVKADGNVRNLAWRICNAKQVLAPYSMSATDGGADGAGTPTEEKDN